MSTKKTTRQRFMNASLFSETANHFQQSIQTYKKELEQGGLTLKAEQSFLWLISLHSLELLILKFTNGGPIDSIRNEIPNLIQNFEEFIQAEAKYRSSIKNKTKASTLEITQLEAYVSIIWLLALCKLTHQEDYIPRVISWLDNEPEFNRGRDVLLENIIELLLGHSVPANNVILHPKPYLPLGCATVYPADKRVELLKQFLAEWYKGMKHCYWHGSHSDKQSLTYFGYWAFEAALVTVLLDIDDSSYHDHLHYPKDLVEWYRNNQQTTQTKENIACPANSPCPQTGWWFTPAKPNSRAFFNQGDTMPDFPGSEYGKVIWQWDADQSNPSL